MWKTPYCYPVKCDTPMDSVLACIFTSFCPLPFLAFNIDRLETWDGTTMAYRWPAGTAFKRIVLDVEDRLCPVCGRFMHVCDHRYHHLWTLAGPTQVVNHLVRCPAPS